MPGTLTDSSADTFVPSFGSAGESRTDWRHWGGIAAASVVVHIFLGMGAVAVLRVPPPRFAGADLNIAQRPRERVTPLVAPPSALTQTAPNRGQISKEFDLASLPPRPAQPNAPASPGAAAAPRQRFTLPKQRNAGLSSSALPEAPSLDLRASATPPPIGVPVPPPPPQIQPQEKPKLAFEKPGATTGAPAGAGRVPIPKPAGTVEEAARQLSRSGGRGLIVGDDDPGSAGSNPSAPSVPVPGKLGSSVELLSDPGGVDFWPYMMRVLSSVRRNWFAVIPESARLGRQGRTVVQFAISREGTVPKLVIATPSGTDALDRAAVAGISASNPFPPLPAEFKGSQIRLQFVFKYNVR